MERYFKVILRNLDIYQPKNDNELQKTLLQPMSALFFAAKSGKNVCQRS